MVSVSEIFLPYMLVTQNETLFYESSRRGCNCAGTKRTRFWTVVLPELGEVKVGEDGSSLGEVHL